MEVKDYYKIMQDKVIEAEENMTHQEIFESMKELEKYGDKLKQHPIEFYFCLNDFNYKQSVIKKLNLREDDVVLDVGTGVADLPLMIKNKVKHIYALEFHKSIYDLAYNYVKDIPNITFMNVPFQDYDFPKEITKCVMLAWHCSPMTLMVLMDKLKETDCRILVHNIGKANSIQVKTATQINSTSLPSPLRSSGNLIEINQLRSEPPLCRGSSLRPNHQNPSRNIVDGFG